MILPSGSVQLNRIPNKNKYFVFIISYFTRNVKQILTPHLSFNQTCFFLYHVHIGITLSSLVLREPLPKEPVPVRIAFISGCSRRLKLVQVSK